MGAAFRGDDSDGGTAGAHATFKCIDAESNVYIGDPYGDRAMDPGMIQIAYVVDRIRRA